MTQAKAISVIILAEKSFATFLSMFLNFGVIKNRKAKPSVSEANTPCDNFLSVSEILIRQETCQLLSEM